MSELEFPEPGMKHTTAIAGFIGFAVVGVGIGIVGNMLLGEREIVQTSPEIVKAELSEEELLAMCDETNEDVRDALNNAHQKVLDLESQLEVKEQKLAEYKEQEETDSARRSAAAKKWREMEQEIARLRVALAEAEAERDQLRTELQDTLVKLDKEIKEKEKAVKLAKKYKRESLDNLWTAFTNNAKVQICDKGTRKRHDNCHEAVDSAIAGTQVRFQECVSKYDTVPVLKEGESGSELPAFAEWLDPDNKHLNYGGVLGQKNAWYVIYCDPTLPEAMVDVDDTF